MEKERKQFGNARSSPESDRIISRVRSKKEAELKSAQNRSKEASTEFKTTGFQRKEACRCHSPCRQNSLSPTPPYTSLHLMRILKTTQGPNVGSTVPATRGDPRPNRTLGGRKRRKRAPSRDIGTNRKERCPTTGVSICVFQKWKFTSRS